MKRNATAVWSGSLKEGKGEISSQSATLDHTPYSYHSRFEEGVGTTPEELIAAAHCGCFAMALSLILGEEGFVPDRLEASATVEMDPEQLKLTHSHLVLKAKIPGISEEKFNECAEKAKENCPISKALNLEIKLEATLL